MEAGEPARESAPRPSPLTAREREVIRLVARGLSNKEIASRLGLSEHTVHRHVGNILTRLDLPSRAAAVAYAAQSGLLDNLSRLSGTLEIRGNAGLHAKEIAAVRDRFPGPVTVASR